MIYRNLIVAVLGLLGAEASALAGETDVALAPLKGVPGVAVSVSIEALPDKATGNDALEDQIRTDVELRLRHRGMNVFTQEQVTNRPAADGAVLFVDVATQQVDKQGVVYHLQLGLGQFVVALASKTPTMAETWRRRTMQLVPPAQDAEAAIRSDVLGGVDEFVGAYLSVNPDGKLPKPSPKAKD